MVDRISQFPGRVKLTPVAGTTDKFDMEMADEPTVQGTPLNKATLLKDTTVAMLGLASAAVPDDAFASLAFVLPTLTVSVVQGGVPAIGATVTATLNSKSVTATTDANGEAMLYLTALGTWGIEVTKDGETAVTEVDISEAGQSYTASVPLLAPLPEGYTALQYIETVSTKKSAFDSGVVLESDSKLEFNFEVTALSNNTSSGVYQGPNTSAKVIYLSLASSQWQTLVRNYYYNFSSGPSINTAYRLSYDLSNPTVLTVNGADITGTASAAGSGISSNLPTVNFVFGSYYVATSNAFNYSSDIRYSGISIFDGQGNKQKVFAPAKRNEDDAVGMYDRVSGAFHAGIGPDPFIAGPEVA